MTQVPAIAAPHRHPALHLFCRGLARSRGGKRNQWDCFELHARSRQQGCTAGRGELDQICVGGVTHQSFGCGLSSAGAHSASSAGLDLFCCAAVLPGSGAGGPWSAVPPPSLPPAEEGSWWDRGSGGATQVMDQD